MKEKIISWILWAILGWTIVFSYWYFMNSNIKSNNVWVNTWKIDNSNMSDEQIERMATRLWISKEELKQKIDSGEDLRSIMWNNWWFWWERWNRSISDTIN